jgi:hypothetical protein
MDFAIKNTYRLERPKTLHRFRLGFSGVGKKCRKAGQGLPSGCSTVVSDSEIALAGKGKDFRVVGFVHRVFEGELCIITINVKNLDLFYEFLDVRDFDKDRIHIRGAGLLRHQDRLRTATL